MRVKKNLDFVGFVDVEDRHSCLCWLCWLDVEARLTVPPFLSYLYWLHFVGFTSSLCWLNFVDVIRQDFVTFVGHGLPGPGPGPGPGSGAASGTGSCPGPGPGPGQGQNFSPLLALLA